VAAKKEQQEEQKFLAENEDDESTRFEQDLERRVREMEQKEKQHALELERKKDQEKEKERERETELATLASTQFHMVVDPKEEQGERGAVLMPIASSSSRSSAEFERKELEKSLQAVTQSMISDASKDDAPIDESKQAVPGVPTSSELELSSETKDPNPKSTSTLNSEKSNHSIISTASYVISISKPNVTPESDAKGKTSSDSPDEKPASSSGQSPVAAARPPQKKKRRFCTLV
jgi:hypothetical protein